MSSFSRRWDEFKIGLSEFLSRVSRFMFKWFIVVSVVLLVSLLLFLLSIFHPELIDKEFIANYLLDMPVPAGLLDLRLPAGLFAMLIGGMVGAIELIGRYRDEPFVAITASGSYLYIAVNAILSLLAFVGLLIWYPNDVAETELIDQVKSLVQTAMLAGFGSLIFMRTAVARTQIGGKEVSVGPAFFIDTLLKAADRSVDRYQAFNRIGNVAGAMNTNMESLADIKVDISKIAIVDLVAVCANSLQNLEPDEREALDNKIKKLDDLTTKGVNPEAAKYVGGMHLQQVIGTDAFDQACKVLANMKPGDDSNKSVVANQSSAIDQNLDKMTYFKPSADVENVGLEDPDPVAQTPETAKDSTPEEPKDITNPEAVPKPPSS